MSQKYYHVFSENSSIGALRAPAAFGRLDQANQNNPVGHFRGNHTGLFYGCSEILQKYYLYSLKRFSIGALRAPAAEGRLDQANQITL